MAAVVSLLGTATFNTTSGSKTVTATPAVGDLIVIVTAHSGNTATTAPTDNNSGGGGTYTLVNTAVKATSADTMKIWVRDALITSATSTVFTHNPGTTSGGGIVAMDIQGMSKVGSASIVQSAIQSNIASGTPAPVLGATPKSYNPIIGAVFNATNTATLTERTSYTEIADLGYNTPATGLEVMYRNSGETSATITWGGTSPSAFASIAVELDSTILNIANTSLSGAGTVSFVGSRKQTATSSFTGTGTLSTTPRVVKFVNTSLNSTGTVSVTGVIKKLVNADLSSLATISSSYIWRQNYDGFRATEDDNIRITEVSDFRVTEKFIDAFSNLNALGTFSATGTVISGNQTYYGIVNATGTGTLTPTARLKVFGTGSYTGIGTQTFTATKKLNCSSSFNGTGTLSGSSLVKRNAASSLSAAGTKTFTALRTTKGIVNLSSTGSQLSAGVRTVFGSTSLTGTLTVSNTAIRKVSGLFSPTGTGNLVVTPNLKLKGLFNKSGAGTLVSTAGTKKIAGSSLTATGTTIFTAFDSVMYVKVGSTWKTSIPYVKDNSIWKRPVAIYKKQSGSWVKVA
jgi:hypothetical protein